jgi:hypothetical protein
LDIRPNGREGIGFHGGTSEYFSLGAVGWIKPK